MKGLLFRCWIYILKVLHRVKLVLLVCVAQMLLYISIYSTQHPCASTNFFTVYNNICRTAINSQSGVRTPAGGIWTGALVIVAIVVLTPYFFYIPEAALAAVIIAAVVQMVEYEIVLTLWRVKS